MLCPILADDSSNAAIGVGLIAVLCVVGFFFFCLPVIVALVRGHPSWAAIFLLWLFFGWTVIGWLIALIWSFSGVPEERHR